MAMLSNLLRKHHKKSVQPVTDKKLLSSKMKITLIIVTLFIIISACLHQWHQAVVAQDLHDTLQLKAYYERMAREYPAQ